jgi:hypothetical protein
VLGWGSPTVCVCGPICSCAKASKASRVSQTSVTRRPESVSVTQWNSAFGGVGPPRVRPMAWTTWSYWSRVPPSKSITTATATSHLPVE